MTETASNLARSALAGHSHKGRHGTSTGVAGVTAHERAGLAIASLAAAKGKAAELSARIKSRAGIDLPPNGRAAATGHLSFVWSAPGQWLALADGDDGANFAQELARDLAGLASVTDQSDGRVVIRVSGVHARDALAKGCMIDLHPGVFKVGDTATTPIALVTTQITRVADDGGLAVYDLSVMRSFAVNFWHWLEDSAAEFGFQVD